MTTTYNTIQRARRRRPSPHNVGRISNFLLLISLAFAAVVGHAGADDFTMGQVFNAIDSNHDHSISEAEYTSAVNKLLGSGSGAASGSTGGGSGAPPLGLDSKPHFGSGGISLSDKLKFDNPASTTAFFKALFASFSAIMATEIGDKTFFIAAVLSMRNDRMAVFGGAILALIIMTILSTLMGLVLPTLLPRTYTHYIGGILFLYFGFKLLFESRGMEDKVSEELEEVEEELAEMNKKKNKSKKKKEAEENVDDDDEENGDAEGGAIKRRGGGKNLKHAPSSGMSAAGDYSGSSWEAVFLQALSMTFLAEWGDRSQIATIALASSKDPIGVTIGGCIGHSICTGMAVVGGRMLASRISEKSVAFYGGLVFLAFGVHSVFLEE